MPESAPAEVQPDTFEGYDNEQGLTFPDHSKPLVKPEAANEDRLANLMEEETKWLPKGRRFLPNEPIVRFPPNKAGMKAHFKLLQRYEGVVESVGEASFVARLIDKTNPEGEESIATLDLDALSRPSDKSLVEPGAVFYWSIGYKIHPSGMREHSATLIFRRLPAWSSNRLDEALKTAREPDDFFSFSPDPPE